LTLVNGFAHKHHLPSWKDGLTEVVNRFAETFCSYGAEMYV